MSENRKHLLIRNFPITKRLLILMLIVSIIPLIIIGSSSYLNSKKSVQQLSNAYDQKLIDTFCLCIDLITQNYLNLSDELMLDSLVQNTLKNYTSLKPSEKYDANRLIYEQVRSKYSRISDVANIRIVTTSNIPILSTGYFYLDSETTMDIFEKIQTHETSSLWYFTQYKNKTYLILTRKIKNFPTGEDIGYIIMHIHTSALTEFFSDFDDGNQIAISLIDMYNGTLSMSENTPIFSEDSINFVFSQPKTETSIIQDINNEKNYYIHCTLLDSVGWRLISSIPESELTAPLESVKTGISFIAIISILFSLLLIWYTVQTISNPLQEMIQKIESLSELNFKDHSSRRSNDELGFLSDAYTAIFNKMQHLTEQIKTEQEEKRNAEIKMLQAQINPHFLFNTLDSLKFTALLSNAPTVSQGLTSLSHILRNSIVDKTNFITIAEEVRNIEDYLVIQKIRYGETITLCKQITDDTSHCLIMKFLLQPIIENSIIHGLTEDKCIDIHLSVNRVNDKIVIVLTDNGKGFDVNSQFDAASNRFKSSKLSGIGLENIRERLALEYGEEQIFSITSKEHQGTTVLISFPFTT